MTARLEDVLMARGLLSSERMAEALRDHALGGGQLDTVLLELGGLSEKELLSALAEAADVQPLHLGDYEPNVAVASELAADIAERLDIVPVSTEDSTLHVASAFPVPQLELQALGAMRHRHIVPWVAVSARVRDWLSVLYGLPIPAREAAVLAALEPHRPLPPPPTPGPAAPSGLDEGLTLEELLARDLFGAQALAVAAVEKQKARSGAPTSATNGARAPERLKTQRDFPMLGTTAFPLSAPAPPAKPAPREPLVEWTLEEARTALRAVTSDRDGIKDVALRYGRRTFDFLAAFAVVHGKAVGWDALGEGADKQRLLQLSVPLDVPSLFRTVALAHAAYAGPVPKDEVTRDVLAKLRRTPRTVFLHPVEVKGRLVALIYGDRTATPLSQRRLSDFRLFCQELSGAFSELLVLRRQLASPPSVAPPPPAEAKAPESATAGAARGRGFGWAPSVREAPESLGRSASRPAPAKAEADRPPPDFQPLLSRLLGTEPAERARAMAELSRTPEPAARILAQAFPGPTAWSRAQVEELPEADELGPVPGALVRLGRPGAAALAALLDAPSADTRYFALLTAGNLVFPEVVPGVLRGLFDLVPELSSAARIAARALRRLPRFEAAMPSLRQELAARDPMRRILAARALGALRDRQAVEGLIGLTGSDDVLCATAAADALAEITRASYGTTRRAWVAWWAENRRRTRPQWLLAALRHPDIAVRRAAAEELASALGETLGYSPAAPESQREAAVHRWELMLPDPRLKTLE
jgi:HEAT repeat protein